MQNESIDTPSASAPRTKRKFQIRSPFLALFLAIAPFLSIFLAYLDLRLPTIIFLYALLAPIAGMMIGFAYLTQMKVEISKVGKVIAMISIAIPIILIAFVITLFVGAAIGFIPLM